MTTTLSSKSGKLALLGGAPVCTEKLICPAWPPADEATGDALREVYLSRKWSFNGEQELAFDREFASFCGAKHGIFMANGTVTLLAGLKAYNIGAGDEVIVPALTWIATAMAAVYAGATPVFVDIDPNTLCIDVKKVEAAITPRTRAIIPVHLYGSTVDMDALCDLAKRRNLIVIEDCAHAHGGKWAGQGLGSIGHVGSFSFQQSKSLASGEGGLCLTNDDEIAQRLQRFKHIGYEAGVAQSQAKVGPPRGLLCHNFRGTEFQAVILRSQLRNLGPLMARYNQNAALLGRLLQDSPGVRVQTRGRRADPQSYYALALMFDHGPLRHVPRATIIKALAAEGVTLMGTYGPVYKHMLFNLEPAQYRMAEGGCPVADTIGTEYALVLMHYWLGADAGTIEAIAAGIHKVACNAEALRNVDIA
jgi:L-glutamine:2-deoxy-scyllo-inosose/3-amino-2,3-dideoxy-scyllo-inosose aminotransferase